MLFPYGARAPDFDMLSANLQSLCVHDNSCRILLDKFTGGVGASPASCEFVTTEYMTISKQRFNHFNMFHVCNINLVLILRQI